MRFSNHLPALICMGIAFVLLLILGYISEGSYGGEDSFMHFLFAYYAPSHPELYFNLWGKPLFTFLSSPFAAFGFMGIKVFNILCGMGTAWLGYRIALSLGWARAWVAIPLILCNALFFVSLLSGLTEPLFALILMGSLYLFIREKYIATALLISFLPFVRSEGNLMMIVLGFALLAKGKWKVLPCLLLGTLLLSIAGGLWKGDYLWLKTENPYRGAEDIYGSGPFLHFFRANKEMYGVPQSILLIAGLMSFVWAIWKKKYKATGEGYATGLIFAFLLVYILAHSWFWYKGIFSSLGLIRVMAAVVPLSSLIALAGLNFGIDSLVRKRIPALLMLLSVLYFVVYDPFFQYKFPFPLSTNQQLMKQAADWYKQQDYKRVYTEHPYFCYAAGIDYFDYNQRVPLHVILVETPDNQDLIVWDSHLGKNEGGVPEDWYKAYPEIEEIGILDQGLDFRIRMFRKKMSENQQD